MLTQYKSLPDGLLDLPAARLGEVLPGPALIHLPGRHTLPLFVSVLLHGNEDTGWLAAQEILRKYAAAELPRALSLFIGNVAAARSGVRRLDDQPDYNRVWPGSEEAHPAERAMMQEVVDAMRARGVFASIDIHNNTGLNPHYACVNRLDQAFLHLAALFSRIVVYFIRPRGVQSAAFAELCPAVTLECGKPGTPGSVEHAVLFLEACLHLSEFPAHPVAPHDIDLFHTVATVKVPEQASFGFAAPDADIDFVSELDHFNFRELARGERLGRVREGSPVRLQVRDENDIDIGMRLFDYCQGEITLRQPLMPAMLTRDERVIRQDCLCYLMERIGVP
ncbi:MAG: succinylglutamate desuccinylase/aspartoacylase family protein [Gammaproteobacteria bacterium]|nr:succinylglutamate desuccinylase/aspartoacylase family protein [Gammaproteobacteria bacterium]MBU1733488.1 succinylglutamate desuccinylase/aspartoacylase family protein [Gammaproteobacteria bacterium]MBU1891905.1 succinylglutamate desuccinylase/aspartoacylase family protein [Gammaproteobacteria bacterium]